MSSKHLGLLNFWIDHKLPHARSKFTLCHVYDLLYTLCTLGTCTPYVQCLYLFLPLPLFRVPALVILFHWDIHHIQFCHIIGYFHCSANHTCSGTWEVSQAGLIHLMVCLFSAIFEHTKFVTVKFLFKQSIPLILLLSDVVRSLFF